jgi:cytochrome c oxidase subunit 2
MLAVAVLAAAGALAAQHWYPPVISAHGRSVQGMLDYSLAVTGVFLVLGHIALAWLLLGRGVVANARGVFSRRPWLLPLIPAVGMAVVAEGGALLLGLPAWGRYYGEPPADALDIEVTGRQFFWLFRYAGPDGRWGTTSAAAVTSDNPLGLLRESPGGADDVVTMNELYVPKGRPVRLVLRSYDVIHSFFVPALRLKQDAMPGMGITVWFQANEAGEYEVACNQICGMGHYRMKAILHVATGDEVTRWLSTQ